MKQFDPIDDLARRRARDREVMDCIEHGGEIRRMFPTPKVDNSVPAPEAPAKEKCLIQSMINDVYAKRAK